MLLPALSLGTMMQSRVDRPRTGARAPPLPQLPHYGAASGLGCASLRLETRLKVRDDNR
jgi:hypothetical protein